MNFQLSKMNEEQRRKLLIGGLAGFVVIVLLSIIFMLFFTGDNSQEETGTIDVPEAEKVQQYNNKLETLGKGGEEVVDSTTYFQELNSFFGQEQSSTTPNQTPNYDDKPLLSNSDFNSSSSSGSYSSGGSPSSNYNAYGNRDMYTIPEKKSKPNYSYRNEEPVYEEPLISHSEMNIPQYTPPVTQQQQQPTAQNHVQSRKSKFDYINNDSNSR